MFFAHFCFVHGFPWFAMHFVPCFCENVVNYLGPQQRANSAIDTDAQRRARAKASSYLNHPKVVLGSSVNQAPTSRFLFCSLI